MLAAFNLLIGSLEQDAKHIIGDQRRLAALGTTTGKPRYRHCGSLVPRMLWHRVVSVVAQFIERFDGDETGL
ncbi:hypothetical protein D3C81_2011860 [compost metagenome]